MGAFDKKKAFGIGGIITVIGAIGWGMNFVADYYQAKEGFEKSKNPVTATSVVETVEKTTRATKAKQEDVIEVNAVEQAEPETVPPTEPPTAPPTEPQPVSVYINDLEYMSCENDVEEQSNLKDNVGNMYHKGLFMYRNISFIGDTGCYGEGSANYYIQGKYTTFSGTVAVPSGNENNTRSSFFEIYGDGNLLYTSPVMTNTSFPENFSIDITGVQLLTISYPESNENSELATLYDGLLS